MIERNWSVEETTKKVATVRINTKRSKKWEQWVLISADRHLDNPMSQRKLQKMHLAQAVERDALVLDLGDCFCAMQGKTDRRGSKSKVMVENQEDDYFGSLVRSGYDFFSHYRNNLAVWGKGNHEGAVLSHHEFDVTRAFVDKLRDNGSPCVMGGFTGWIRFMFTTGSTGYCQSLKMYYTHGTGGSAPVTKGVIQTNRRASFIDADIICSGHIHESWSVELCRAGLNEAGAEFIKNQLHLSIPTYKEEFLNQSGGFHNEKNGSAPKPIGAWWLRFYWCTTDNKVKFDYVRAK